MRTTIDGAGRVVVPKSIRDSLGLAAGQPLEIIERNGAAELRPVGRRVWIEERDGAFVAVTEEPVPPLTTDEVRDLVERSRR
ncbi:MAG: AbrB/MazE/SpoVT family DNA-binding domain-containing protein [Acidimicrobiales bacterium]